jgi:hypothetical protein
MRSRIGEDRHVMTYCIAGGQAFNMVLSHPDRDAATSTAPDASQDILERIQKEFVGWDPQYVGPQRIPGCDGWMNSLLTQAVTRIRT